MDPLHLSIALGPLAVYFLVLGLLNLTPRPFLTTGGRDWGALGVGLSGLIVAGPMELFFPEGSASVLGPFVWLMLLALYLLTVLLIVLLARPRLVIYNISVEEFHRVLETALPNIDPDARLAADTLVLPNLGVQAYLEPFGSLRNLQIIASGPRQNYNGWRDFEIQLAAALREVRVPSNPYGVTQLLFSGLMIAAILYYMVGQQQEVAQSLKQMLRW